MSRMTPSPAGRAVTPLWYQVAVLLRGRILSGVYTVGTKIPPENQLAAEFGVSRLTLRRALDVLEGESLLRRQQGVGTTVRSHGEAEPAKYSGRLEDLLIFMRGTDATQVQMKEAAPPAWVVDALKISRSKKLMVVGGVTMWRGSPIAYGCTYLPKSLSDKVDLESLKRGKMIMAQLQSQKAMKIGWGQQTVRATAATLEVAEHLDIEQGAPVLAVKVVIFDEKNEPSYCYEFCTALELTSTHPV